MVIDIEKTPSPILFISPKAKVKLNLYIELAIGEISGLGTVSRLGNDFYLTDVHLFEQVCSFDRTVLSSDDVGKFLFENEKLGRDNSELKLWWHSHGNSQCFWSPDDDDTAESFDNGWMISLVCNKQGKCLARLDLFEPIRLVLDNLDLRVRLEGSDELRQELAQEIEAKVRFVKPRRKRKKRGDQAIVPNDVTMAVQQIGRQELVKG